MKKTREELDALLGKLESDLIRLYGNTYSDVLKIQQVRNAINSGADFTWKGNPAAAEKLEKKLNVLGRQVEERINNGVEIAYNMGPSYETINAIGALTGKTEAGEQMKNKVIEDATKDMRKRGATAEKFYNDPQGGLTISDRIWDNIKDSKKELQAIIQSEIAQGHSADRAVKSVRTYLIHPEEIPQFVKDAEGKLVLNEAWVNYHPGNGIYKSAYKNALRLTRTEINMAYHKAECEQMKSNPLIKGYRVVTSGNHPKDAKGRSEICEVLAGEYPKTFVFTGWHPQCRCHIEPITISKDDFKERIRRMKEGTEDSYQPTQITDVPKNFTDYIDANAEAIKAAKTKPFFVRDNYKGGDIDKGFISDIEKQMKVKPTPKPAPKVEPKAEPKKPTATTSQTKAETEKAAALEKDLQQYTPEQRAFFDDFTNKTGIERGLSMTEEQADRQNANPKYFEDKDYRVNCQTCVPTYILRLYGYDVEATPNRKNSLNSKMAAVWANVWLDKDGNHPSISYIGDWASKKKYTNMTQKRYLEYLDENCKEDGIYQFTLTWSGRRRARHTTIIQREKGVLKYLEPQLDNSKNSKRAYDDIDFMTSRLNKKPCNIKRDDFFGDGIIRIDGLTIDPKYYSLFRKSTKQV